MPEKNIQESITNKDDTPEELPLKTKSKIKLKPNQNLINAFKSITVEPVLALFIISSVMALMATQNLNLEKACRVNLQYDEQICKALRERRTQNLTLYEKEVQKTTSSVYIWKSVMKNVLTMIPMLFIGAWSDKTGKRKICMILPILGELITSLLNMLSTYFFYEIPMELTVFMEIIFPSLAGGWFNMFLGCYSYLGDITSRENRTFRYGILSMCMTVGFPFGAFLSGLVLKKLGFYGVFSISAAMNIVNLAFVVFYLQDHEWIKDKDKTQPESDQKPRGFFKEFFDLHGLRKTLDILLNHNKKERFILILIGVSLYFGPMSGERDVAYLSMQNRFNWDAVKYSYYLAYSLVLHSLGTIFSIAVLSRILGFDDAVLGMISTLSKIAGAILMAHAVTDTQVYSVPLVEMLNGSTAIALRSIASKLVSYQELGKLYALYGLVELLTPAIFEPTYIVIYRATLAVFPGTFYIVSAAITLPGFLIFAWFYRKHLQDKKDNRVNIPNLPSEGVNA